MQLFSRLDERQRFVDIASVPMHGATSIDDIAGLGV